MKKKNLALIILMALSLFWVGCKKDDHDQVTEQMAHLTIGEWKL